ncbi:chondroitin sulfate synthase 1-like isoform X1 [Branchiostoma floridae]|uniref:N-acetylgalactosaminyl-proteoglycan 3-beta-glucuronosyltransferase n=2 Tax=Branchiostoma floridae TaxID=7739 RepID=A0A9J7LYM8_BRAFL|nr:chondroitin sulfate synthase 1-like isoform X1 [Branchiostoma floridae]
MTERRSGHNKLKPSLLDAVSRSSKTAEKMTRFGIRMSRKTRQTVSFISGVVIGFWIMLTIMTHVPDKDMTSPVSSTSEWTPGVPKEGWQAGYGPTSLESNQKHIYIGVMTARKYLNSRVVAVYETWGKQVPGKVEFFSAYDPKHRTPRGIPVVTNIPGIDDTYPPQKKSFLMLKYMHDFYIDKYEWFIRADDDVYIRVDKLQKFLRSVNSSKPLYIGQSESSQKNERLSMSSSDSFCLGGPGVILSRETLRRIAPHISHCLKNMYSKHEDVEIGRCIKRFANVSCTRASDTERIFFNDLKCYKKGSVQHLYPGLVQHVITVHPNKGPKDQYKFYTYFSALRLEVLQQRMLELFRTIDKMTNEL